MTQNKAALLQSPETSFFLLRTDRADIFPFGVFSLQESDERVGELKNSTLRTSRNCNRIYSIEKQNTYV